MEKRQRFTAEFKREAVRLTRTANKPAAVVARELGVPRSLLAYTLHEMHAWYEFAIQGGKGRA